VGLCNPLRSFTKANAGGLTKVENVCNLNLHKTELIKLVLEGGSYLTENKCPFDVYVTSLETILVCSENKTKPTKNLYKGKGKVVPVFN
jgi:hypothetical protein